MSVFGKNIKKIRILKNLSQQDFGEKFEISRGSIGSYEEGRAEPKIDSIIKIARHYNISIDLILTKELTVNELSNYANKISKHILVEETVVQNTTKTISNKPYIEERVQLLEERLKSLENNIITKKEK